MKKIVYAITIVGMLLLSCFTIPTTFADETDDIVISNEKPKNGATNVSISLSKLFFDLNESHGDIMSYTVGTNPDIGDGSGIADKNGTNSVDVTGLDWNTVYTWYVNVTIARDDYKNETFNFTTLQPDTVYVDDGFNDSTSGWGYDHFDNIQDGIDQVAEIGTVYVYNGTYQGDLDVDKSIALTGENIINTIITGLGGVPNPAISISADYVDISGFTIKEANIGILIDSSNNTIVENTIQDNSEYGIYIDEFCNDSNIYHNNFINNSENANDTGNNIWYSSDLKEGNYWSDFDEPSEGAYDNNTDRIVDKSYNISDGDSQDRYPLMFPYGEIPPVAAFTYTVDGATIKFTSSSSYDRDGTIVSYYWDFGDGTNSTSEEPVISHEYGKDNETYKVNLTVTDNTDKNATISKDVTTDATAPTLEIIQPKRGLYIRNNLIRKRLIRVALVVGGITIKVNAVDEVSGIRNVEIWIDGKLKANHTTDPYTYDWTRDRIRLLFHIHLIKVVAYDNAGNSATRTMLVRKFL